MGGSIEEPPAHAEARNKQGYGWAARWAWVLGIILAVGLGLRAYGLGSHGLWYDEVVSANVAVGSSLEWPLTPDGTSFTAADFWKQNNLAGLRRAVILEDGGNGVLYSFFQHFWVRLFGLRALALRVPALAAGTLLVLAVFLLARELFDERTALWAAGFAAIQPLLVRYSQENRAYALATLLGVLATLWFVRITAKKQRSGRAVLAYGLLCGAALLGHYLAVGVLAAHGVFAAVRVRGRAQWGALAAAWLIGGSLLGAWYLAGGREGLKETSRRNHNYQVRAANPSVNERLALPATPRNLAAGGLQTALALAGPAPGSLRIAWLLPVLPLVFWMAAGVRFRSGNNNYPDAVLLLLLLSVSGLGLSTLLAAASGHIISFQTTYANFAAPFAALLLGAGTSERMAARDNGWGPRAALAAYGALVAVTLAGGYQGYRVPAADEYQALVRKLETKIRPGEVVEYGCWETARYCNLYLPPESGLVQRVDLKRDPREIRVLDGEVERLRVLAPVF